MSNLSENNRIFADRRAAQQAVMQRTNAYSLMLRVARNGGFADGRRPVFPIAKMGPGALPHVLNISVGVQKIAA